MRWRASIVYETCVAAVRSMRGRSISLLLLGIALTSMSGVAAQTVVFGPETFRRTPGFLPDLYSRTFNVAKPEKQYTLRVVNDGILAAAVTLNGQVVLGLDDFAILDRDRDPDRRPEPSDWVPIPLIQRTVTIKKGSNRISVLLVAGRPGSSLTIAISSGTGTDTTAPTITATVSPAPNANGWNNSNVTVTFSCKDNTAIATCPPPTTVTTEGAAQVVSGTATDTAGNTASTSVQVSLDKTAPTITSALGSSPGASGWFTEPVSVQFTCADARSGIATCPPTEVVATEGTQTITRSATDRAGNTATASAGPLRIDLSAPVITASLTPAANAGGWNNTPVTVHYVCSDTGAGVPSCPADAVLSTDGAGQTLSQTATDLAGRTASVTSTVNIDQATPEVLIQIAETPGASGWFTTSVAAHFECADATSGVDACPADRVVSAEGTQTIEVTVVDRAGNTKTVSSDPIRIDTGAPTITATLDPPANANGWHSGPVTIHFDCADGGAGIASCPPDQVVADEGADQSVIGNTVDHAGNASVAFAAFHIDRTPPVLTLTSPANGITLLTPTVTTAGEVSDAVSGLSSVNCNDQPATVSGGILACTITLAPGANDIAATATDQAGNQTSVTLGVRYARTPVITFTSPQSLGYLNISPTTVTGTVDDPAAVVTINSIPASMADGAFTLALPLAEGPNTITATATLPEGGVSTASLTVTLDTTPPHVTITSPADQFVTAEESISVAGIVNDIVVGTVNEQQAQVFINGVPAQVANRTFLATNVPLVPGLNVIRAIGTDRVNNEVISEITVTRRVLTAAQIRPISGNNQAAAIGAPLGAPLVVALTDGLGAPVPNTPVIFKVTQNDGTVAAGATPAPSVIATTDAQGRASVEWTLGHRAGAGGNAVEAAAVGFEGLALFTATGTQGTAAKIVIDTGNDQVGLAGESLPKPFIAVVVDEGNNRLAGVPVTFTAIQGGGKFNGQTTIELVTDPDGRAAATLTLGPEEGNGNNFAQATFTSNEGFRAGFFASARHPGNPADTAISGVVLDNSNVPVPGVTVRAVLTNVLYSNNVAANQAPAVQTNAQGQFVLKPAPVGFVKLIIDGSTASLPGSYPTLDYDMVTVVGQDNTVGQPIYILPISPVNQLCVDPSDPSKPGGTLTIPEAPGFSLSFNAGQVTFPGGTQVGCVSVTVVNGDKVPMVPGFGQQPRFIVTIQPAGAHFNPPAAITLPNVDGLAPREVTEMYSFDHDIGSFVAIGTGIVSDDGLIVRSSPGVGVLKAGWHCGGNPSATGVAANCPFCQTCKTDNCEADPGKNGQELPDDKCKICENGSPKPVDVLPIGLEHTRTYGPPETATKKINDALKKLEKLGVIASVNLLQIQGKVTAKECCDPASGKGKGIELAGSVTGDFGGLTVKAKVWPLGPIPTFDATIDFFGLASLQAKAQFVGGVFFNLSAKVTGQIGYKKKECSKTPEDQEGCFHGKLEIGLTPGLSAEVGGNASLTFDCFFCDKTTIAVAGSLVLGEFSWPISIAGVQFNEANCAAGVTGGFFNPGKGSFKIYAKFTGSYKTDDTGSRKVDVQINFLSCSISGDGVTC